MRTVHQNVKELSSAWEAFPFLSTAAYMTNMLRARSDHRRTEHLRIYKVVRTAAPHIIIRSLALSLEENRRHHDMFGRNNQKGITSTLVESLPTFFAL